MISVDDILDRLVPPAAITVDNLVTVVRTVMEVVETYKSVSGAAKKEAVLQCLQALVRRTDALDTAVLALLPHLIDELVVVSRDGLRINRPPGWRCLGALLERLCRRPATS